MGEARYTLFCIFLQLNLGYIRQKLTQGLTHYPLANNIQFSLLSSKSLVELDNIIFFYVHFVDKPGLLDNI